MYPVIIWIILNSRFVTYSLFRRSVNNCHYGLNNVFHKQSVIFTTCHMMCFFQAPSYRLRLFNPLCMYQRIYTWIKSLSLSLSSLKCIHFVLLMLKKNWEVNHMIYQFLKMNELKNWRYFLTNWFMRQTRLISLWQAVDLFGW